MKTLTPLLRSPWLFVFTICAVTFFTLVSTKNEKPAPAKRKIAFIGMNERAESCKSCLQNADTLKLIALREAVAQLGGFEIVPFSFDKKEAEPYNGLRKTYREIARDTAIVLVVDNLWGKHFKHSQDLIREKNIPVISLEADRNNFPGVDKSPPADFGKNAVFLQPSDHWPKFVIQFLANVLQIYGQEEGHHEGGESEVGFVSEKDYKLDVVFHKEFTAHGFDEAHGCLVDLQDDTTNGLSQIKTKGLRDTAKMFEKIRAFDGKVLVFNLHDHNQQIFTNTATFSKWLNPNVEHILGLNLSKEDFVEIADKAAGVTFYRLEPGGGFSATFEERFGKFKKDNALTIFKKDGAPTTFENTEKKMPTDVLLKEHFQNVSQAAELIAGLMSYAPPKTCTDSMGHHKKGSRGYFSGVFRCQNDLKVPNGKGYLCFDDDQILINVPTFDYIRRDTNEQNAAQALNPYQINRLGEKIPVLKLTVKSVEINAMDVKKGEFSHKMRYLVEVPADYDSSFSDFQGCAKLALHGIKPTLIQNIARPPFYQVGVFESEGTLASKFRVCTYPFDDQTLELPIVAYSEEKFYTIFDTTQVDSSLTASGWEWDECKEKLSWSMETFNDKLDDLHQAGGEQLTMAMRLNVSRERSGAILMIVLPLLIFGLLPVIILFARHGEKFLDSRNQIQSVVLAVAIFGYSLITISPETDGLNKAFLMLAVAFFSNMACLIYAAIMNYHYDHECAQKDLLLKIHKYFPFVVGFSFLAAFAWVIRYWEHGGH